MHPERTKNSSMRGTEPKEAHLNFLFLLLNKFKSYSSQCPFPRLSTLVSLWFVGILTPSPSDAHRLCCPATFPICTFHSFSLCSRRSIQICFQRKPFFFSSNRIVMNWVMYRNKDPYASCFFPFFFNRFLACLIPVWPSHPCVLWTKKKHLRRGTQSSEPRHNNPFGHVHFSSSRLSMPSDIAIRLHFLSPECLNAQQLVQN